MEVLVGQGLRLASILGSSPVFVSKSFPKSARYALYAGSRFREFDPSERYHPSRLLSYNYSSCLNNFPIRKQALNEITKNNGSILARCCTSIPPSKEGCKVSREREKNITLLQKMKQMAKDYWYILVPVHLVTSAAWTTIFYLTLKNGVDIASIMEYLHVADNYVQAVRSSKAGTWAVVYLLYKVFTPLRYTVTLGGTTMVIRSLDKRGILKASQLKQGIKEHKELKKRSNATKPDLKPEKGDSPKS